MIALPQLSAIQFSGIDAGMFLHNQLSADVLGLKEGESTFACYCDPKGRVLALMLVGRIEDDYFVILSAPLAATVAARLKIYVMRSDVRISVLEDHQVTGLDDHEAATDTTGLTLPIPGSGQLMGISLAGGSITTDQSSAADWKISELQRGICWLDSSSSGEFLPQMLGFDRLGAINFRKGCYPGQEIVARTHYLGKVKRFPRVFKTPNPIAAKPLEKVTIHSGEQSFEAVVVDLADSDAKGSWMLVVTRMEEELAIDRVEFAGTLSPVEVLA